MIRLGSLAGYPFEGPRVLAGWAPPTDGGVFAVLYRPEPERAPERYAVIYVGHADDLSATGLPFRHPASRSWVERAGGRFGLYLASYVPPGASTAHREQIVQELCAVYHPACNEQQFENAWRQEWIGEYRAPTAGPLTTSRSAAPPPDAAG